jgi:Carboxypeptidase regulatory-like domain
MFFNEVFIQILLNSELPANRLCGIPGGNPVHSPLAIGFSWKKCFSNTPSGLLTLLLFTICGNLAFAQQTLGSINGTVADSSGAVIQGAQVKARATATNLEVDATTKADGSFSIADLPIGTYEVKFVKDGFETDVRPQIIVQGNRTATINARLKPGSVASTVTVEATPLLNVTDTTTGYTLNELQITQTPLGTGSFTQLAILSPANDRNASSPNAKG